MRAPTGIWPQTARQVGLSVWTAHGEHSTPQPDLTRCHSRHRETDGLSTERVVAVSTYEVQAVRWDHGWELHIDGVGVTQSHGLGDAERMVRDYLRLDLGAEVAKNATIRITAKVDEEIDREVDEVRQLADELAAKQDELAARSRNLVTRMKTVKRMTGADVAAVLKVSPQRVSQLTAGVAKSAARARAARKSARATGRKTA